jgi:hypothetical protein
LAAYRFLSGVIRDVWNWHFSDLPTPLTNVGYQGKSGSNSDIAKSTRLTLPDMRRGDAPIQQRGKGAVQENERRDAMKRERGDVNWITAQSGGGS